MTKRRDDWRAIAVDLLSVLVFATIGSVVHSRVVDFNAIIWTALPFVTAALVIHVILSVRRVNVRTITSGIVIWLVAWVVGVGFRAAVGDGTPIDFILVAGGFLALFLLGWRVIYWLITRNRPGADAGPADTNTEDP